MSLAEIVIWKLSLRAEFGQLRAHLRSEVVIGLVPCFVAVPHFALPLP